MGTIGRRLELRRFALDNPYALRVGDRVVIGIASRALIEAALIAYGLPLVVALVAGLLAERLLRQDSATLAAMLAGLLVGLVLAHVIASRFAERGVLAPRFLRRAAPFESCSGGSQQ